MDIVSAHHEGGSVIRIYVVDDSDKFRNALMHALSDEDDLEICGEAVNGQDALDHVKRAHPDVVLLDFTMPGMNGLQVARKVRELCPECRIVVLSQYDVAALVKGSPRDVDAFVSKSDPFPVLLHAIKHTQHRRDLPV